MAESSFEAAIEAFWTGRADQAEKQRISGKLDAGARGAVTGGGHLDPVCDLIADVFVAAGFKDSEIHRNVRTGLPGFYRPSKNWDIVVIHREMLVAAIELKSQVGPSFGNNFNNRSEEALGNATDVWRAYEEGTFGSLRPWLGYVFVLEEATKSTKPVKDAPMFMPAERVFSNTSYKERYQILCERLVRERLYDAAWYVTTESGPNGRIHEPHTSLNFASFSAAIAGRATYIQKLAAELDR